MTAARIINAVFWLYMWLSQALLPVDPTTEDFWAEQGRKLFRLNPHFDDPARLIGNAVIPLVLWFFIDWVCVGSPGGNSQRRLSAWAFEDRTRTQ